MDNQCTSNYSIFKLPNIDIRDESSQIAESGFNFEDLPVEIQQMILTKVAVERRLSSETFGEVHDALALVCKLWLELISVAKFYERVKKETFLRDPMCRYLETVQPIQVSWLGVLGPSPCVVRAVCTLGDKMFVLEWPHPSTSGIFVYDIDDSAVRHRERRNRKVTFSNRRPFILHGLQPSLKYILPCSRTNTLYIIGYNDNGLWKVTNVKSDDGTVIRRWNLDPRLVFRKISSHNLSGSYLIITSYSEVYIYDTSSGVLVKTITLGDISEREEIRLVAATLLDESLDSLITLLYPNDMNYLWGQIVLDDHHCRLLLNKSSFTVFDNRTGRNRKLRTHAVTSALTKVSKVWYDKARGLVFFPNVREVTVSRVTH